MIGRPGGIVRSLITRFYALMRLRGACELCWKMIVHRPGVLGVTMNLPPGGVELPGALPHGSWISHSAVVVITGDAAGAGLAEWGFPKG